MLPHFFRYIYYRIYTWNHKNWGKNDLPQYNAMFGISFLMFLNLCIIPALLQALIPSRFPQFSSSETKIIVIALFLILYCINFFLTVKNGRFHKIIVEFQNETKERRKKGTVLMWLYIIFSFGIFLVIGRL